MIERQEDEQARDASIADEVQRAQRASAALRQQRNDVFNALKRKVASLRTNPQQGAERSQRVGEALDTLRALVDDAFARAGAFASSDGSMDLSVFASSLRTAASRMAVPHDNIARALRCLGVPSSEDALSSPSVGAGAAASTSQGASPPMAMLWSTRQAVLGRASTTSTALALDKDQRD